MCSSKIMLAFSQERFKEEEAKITFKELFGREPEYIQKTDRCILLGFVEVQEIQEINKDQEQEDDEEW